MLNMMRHRIVFARYKGRISLESYGFRANLPALNNQSITSCSRQVRMVSISVLNSFFVIPFGIIAGPVLMGRVSELGFTALC